MGVLSVICKSLRRNHPSCLSAHLSRALRDPDVLNTLNALHVLFQLLLDQVRLVLRDHLLIDLLDTCGSSIHSMTSNTSNVHLLHWLPLLCSFVAVILIATLVFVGNESSL